MKECIEPSKRISRSIHERIKNKQESAIKELSKQEPEPEAVRRYSSTRVLPLPRIEVAWHTDRPPYIFLTRRGVATTDVGVLEVVDDDDENDVREIYARTSNDNTRNRFI